LDGGNSGTKWDRGRDWVVVATTQGGRDGQNGGSGVDKKLREKDNVFFKLTNENGRRKCCPAGLR
jgi:hypothetical protein